MRLGFARGASCAMLLSMSPHIARASLAVAGTGRRHDSDRVLGGAASTCCVLAPRPWWQQRPAAIALGLLRLRRSRADWRRGVLRLEPCLTLRRRQAQVVLIDGGPRRRPRRA
eukprot:11761589-Alexandrium_andersonii.AAC.1